MIGLPKKVARRWYLAGVILSVLAIVFLAVLSKPNPRLAYPLAFVFTMFGILAVTRPGWEWPERRPGLVIANSGVFITQIAILLLGMNSNS